MVQKLTEPGVDVKTDAAFMFQLKMNIPILYNILADLRSSTTLPDCFHNLLRYLINRAEDPFNEDNVLPEFPASNPSNLEWYVHMTIRSFEKCQFQSQSLLYLFGHSLFLDPRR